MPWSSACADGDPALRRAAVALGRPRWPGRPRRGRRGNCPLAGAVRPMTRFPTIDAASVSLGTTPGTPRSRPRLATPNVMGPCCDPVRQHPPEPDSELGTTPPVIPQQRVGLGRRASAAAPRPGRRRRGPSADRADAGTGTAGRSRRGRGGCGRPRCWPSGRRPQGAACPRPAAAGPAGVPDGSRWRRQRRPPTRSSCPTWSDPDGRPTRRRSRRGTGAPLMVVLAGGRGAGAAGGRCPAWRARAMFRRPRRPPGRSAGRSQADPPTAGATSAPVGPAAGRARRSPSPASAM